MNALQAIIWKDIRQHSPWAALLMFAAAGALVFAVHDYTPDLYNSLESVMGPQFMMEVKCGCAAAGAVLGFLIVAFDTRGDKWAFLMHRPMPRPRIFWAKILAAWALYLLAAGLPLAVVTAWLLMPGHVPLPYSLAVASPTLADFFAGAVCVPLGMIIAQRPARWYLSRGLPLATMFIVMASTFFAQELWHSLLLSTLLGAVAVTAARGVFIVGASGAPLPRSACAALSIVIFSGLLLVGLSATSIGYLFLLTDRTAFRNFDFLADGRVVVCETGPGIFSMENADGTPAPDLRAYRDQQAFYAVRPPSAHVWNYDQPGKRRPAYWQCSRYFTLLSTQEGSTLWYYLPDAGRVVGYSRADRRPLSSVGPAGFSSPDTAAADRFEGAPISMNAYEVDFHKLLAFPGALYSFNPAERSIRRIFTPPDHVSIRSFVRWNDGKNGPAQSGDLNPRICILTDDRLINTDLQGNIRLSVALPSDNLKLPDRSLVRSFELLHFSDPDRYALATAREFTRSALQVYDIDADGALSSPHVYGPIDRLTDPQRGQWIGFASAGAAGPVITGTAIAAAWYASDDQRYDETTSRDVAVLLAVLVASSLIGGALCASIAKRWRLQRKARIGWALGGAAIGALAPIVMVCVEQRPDFVRCTACGRRHCASGAVCERCGAPMVIPHDGSEVFVPLNGSVPKPT